MKNKYIVRSRISEKKFREILKYFVEDIEATKIANLTGISRISINKILKSIRVLMFKEREKISKLGVFRRVYHTSFQVKFPSPPRSFALRLMKAIF